ncbi:hypothetical protein [Spirochaeta thermophila]|uniref:Uncharacterized protein n=1 Tax=Winmispira thermophila (strain ATCC 49972 / DSM 6192 / RI 19.B1) TaxID=665571 RepID=E0RQS6_WINT6|nr:hypothetical protein [Spirochaeta thermophila]ADN02982.1 hypothetical protein STHERM_c20480 [Spirochaeta thermophila DSM 6192]
MVRYYLSIFPTEGLIASQLSPEDFGAYMATGTRKGAYEGIMFIEVEGGFGSFFDWEYARTRCVPHPDGEPKHSVYLGVYRVLEHIPLENLKELYLTTRDGRTLKLEQAPYRPGAPRSYYLYQELCPITPLVVSSLPPRDFAAKISDGSSKIYVPTIAFADIKTIDFDHPEETGNIGAIYDRNIEHLEDCIRTVVENKEKPTKTIERSHIGSFSYQIINTGVYVGNKDGIVFYPMKSMDELRRHHYDWAKSALII